MHDFTFYLGTPEPSWLWRPEIDIGNIPLFVSRTRLCTRKGLKNRSVRRWGCDSGAFTELTKNGRWTITPRQYADECLWYRERLGMMDFCAIQDWMCEDVVINGGRIGGVTAPGTKLNVREHQKRTVESYGVLTSIEPDLPWLPVLQGFTIEEYLRCVEMYRECNHSLVGKQVGVGSVCRREGSDEIAEVFKALSEHPNGMKLHGFGVKSAGLAKSVKYLCSSDSMAWSKWAWRDQIKMPACVAAGRGHRNCANCPEFAYHWYKNTLEPAIQRGMI